MPNRGPITLTPDDLSTLLDCLPPPRDLKEAEDDEDRMQIKHQSSARQRLEETQAAGGTEAVVILSIDEVDTLIDCLPPPSSGDCLRPKLTELQRAAR